MTTTSTTPAQTAQALMLEARATLIARLSAGDLPDALAGAAADVFIAQRQLAAGLPLTAADTARAALAALRGERDVPAKVREQLAALSPRTRDALAAGTVTVDEVTGEVWDGAALPARLQGTELAAFEALVEGEWITVTPPAEEWSTTDAVALAPWALEVVVALRG